MRKAIFLSIACLALWNCTAQNQSVQAPKAAETKVVETQTLESQAAETQIIETQTVEAQIVETQIVETQQAQRPEEKKASYHRPDKKAASTAVPFTEIKFKERRATQAERELCTASGGKVVVAGRARYETCEMTYPDAGQVCSDKSDCHGQCVANQTDARRLKDAANLAGQMTGTCQKTNSRFGCHAIVKNGTISATLCID